MLSPLQEWVGQLLKLDAHVNFESPQPCQRMIANEESWRECSNIKSNGCQSTDGLCAK